LLKKHLILGKPNQSDFNPTLYTTSVFLQKALVSLDLLFNHTSSQPNNTAQNSGIGLMYIFDITYPKVPVNPHGNCLYKSKQELNSSIYHSCIQLCV